MSTQSANVLLIDEGNTFVKWAFFNADQLLISGAEKSITAALLKAIKKNNSALDTIYLSSVRQNGMANKLDLKKWHLFELTAKSKVPFKNLYQSPHSLGADRKALVAAACSFYPNHPVLVIGAGTCITYDFKDQNNRYYGGAISPGLQMRLDAMAHFTAKLPQLNAQKETSTRGDTTHSALFKGALEGLAHEINGFIDSYKNEHGASLKIMLAGGDALRLESYLKRKIFVEPQLVIYGLMSLYELNHTQ